jgi:hypothetical protein
MKKHLVLIAPILFFIILLLALVSAQEIEQITDVDAQKRIIEVTDSGWILTELEVTNNAELPMFEIEIYEYFNELFELGDNITIISGDIEVLNTMPTASGGQFILQLHFPQQLESNETFKIRYWTRSHNSGDFQVPQSLIWYSFDYQGNKIRQNVYSNGRIVHIRSYAESVVEDTFPYIIAGITFVITILVLRYIRKNFGNVVEKKEKPRIFRYWISFR